ncbi:DUF3905 domain-containing protein [Hazenella sp. IB182353]|uniref:DUF3905 domain-containing protein n=1 Tax=Polycladospora coralii TaxID=2771432 RepID=UPI001746E3F4|nr:DUF3905 domain-containing protein [Polycladospora coralii]MBS7530536.1 DUF3905 domain-containing protein [Polycladospora coralii]
MPEDKSKSSANHIDGTMPHQIHSPDFKRSQRKIEPSFVNEHGIVIGDSHYDSPNSPLNQWDLDTDPAIMAGPEWIHPTNDIGWNTSENRELLEDIPPTEPFSHPTRDAGYKSD